MTNLKRVDVRPTTPDNDSSDRPAPGKTATVPPASGRGIRWSSIIATVFVAIVGTAISSWHAFELVHGSGEPVLVALGYPALIDGVIFMASMVILMSSRRGHPAPLLAWVALGFGALVTLAVNVAHGWDGGLLSRLVSAIPPLAVIGSYELLMRQVRMTAAQLLAVEEEGEGSHPEPPREEAAAALAKVPATLVEAVRLAYDEGASVRGLARDFEITRSRVNAILRQAGQGDDEAADETSGEMPPEEPIAPETRQLVTAMRHEALMSDESFATNRSNGQDGGV